MLHTHEVEGSSPPVSTKKKTTPTWCGFSFCAEGGTRTHLNAICRWHIACGGLDRRNTIILSSPPVSARMGTRTVVDAGTGEMKEQRFQPPQHHNVIESPSLHQIPENHWFSGIFLVERIPPALPVSAEKFYLCVEKKNLQC